MELAIPFFLNSPKGGQVLVLYYEWQVIETTTEAVIIQTPSEYWADALAQRMVGMGHDVAKRRAILDFIPVPDT